MSTSIVTIGTQIPGRSELHATYSSGKSLHDYDVILFDTRFPAYGFDYSGGGSLSEDSSKQLNQDIAHWGSELGSAVDDGKTVFVLLAASESLSARTGRKEFKGNRTINYVTDVDNYSALPFTPSITNSRGSKVKVSDARFNHLYEIVKNHVEYQVFMPGSYGTVVFSTVKGTNTLGTIVKLKEKTGHIVLLPYFNLEGMTEEHKDGKSYWTKAGMKTGQQLIGQLMEIDKVLRKSSEATPPPNWAAEVQTSKKAASLEEKINTIEATIKKEEIERSKTLEQKQRADAIKALLYENGTLLEGEIENVLTMMGYEVSNFREGALEIDHVIVSPEGTRLIGEAEGKDKSAISIDKFRQLETNIQEDFQRDEVAEPAQGVLFGNGFRLQNPAERPDEFTDKCYTNAKRVGTALVKTSDLYPIAVYLSDCPDDEIFKASCRKVIEETKGALVTFPEIPKAK